MFETMGDKFGELIKATEAFEKLGSEHIGDRLAGGMAGFSQKLHDAFLKEGFTRLEAIQMICAILGKKS